MDRDPNPEHDVLVFPIIQAGQFGIREEERAMDFLFEALDEHHSPITTGNDLANFPLLDLTTGYFGLYRPYRDLVLQSPINTRIVASAPKVSRQSSSASWSQFIDSGITL